MNLPVRRLRIRFLSFAALAALLGPAIRPVHASEAFDPGTLRVAKIETEATAPDGSDAGQRSAVLMRLHAQDHYRVREGQTLEPVPGTVYRVAAIRTDGRVDLLDAADVRITIQPLTEEEKTRHLAAQAPPAAPRHADDFPSLPRQHRAMRGDTLAGLAERYYPDPEQGLVAIRAANPDVERRLAATNDFWIVVPALHEALDW